MCGRGVSRSQRPEEPRKEGKRSLKGVKELKDGTLGDEPSERREKQREWSGLAKQVLYSLVEPHFLPFKGTLKNK